MSSFIDENLDYMDVVRNKYNGVLGKVIAIYMDMEERIPKTFLDVRTDRRVHYNTPAYNWELVSKNY